MSLHLKILYVSEKLKKLQIVYVGKKTVRPGVEKEQLKEVNLF